MGCLVRTPSMRSWCRVGITTNMLRGVTALHRPALSLTSNTETDGSLLSSYHGDMILEKLDRGVARS